MVDSNVQILGRLLEHFKVLVGNTSRVRHKLYPIRLEMIINVIIVNLLRGILRNLSALPTFFAYISLFTATARLTALGVAVRKPHRRLPTTVISHLLIVPILAYH